MVAAGPLAAPRRAAALAAAVALTATGCGVLRASEPETIAQPGTVTTGPSGLSQGPYALTTDEGAVITFDLPTVPAPDDEVERLRRDLHVEPVTYVELHIDNTEGARTVQIDDLKVISHEGGQFPFEPAAEVLADWDPNRSEEGGFWAADGSPLEPQAGARLDARTHELIAQYTGAVPVGGTGRELMIGDFENLPRTFDDVELSPYPNDRSQASSPVGHGPEQRQYRAGEPGEAPRGRIEAEPAPAPAAPAAPEPARPAAQPPRVPAAPVTAEPAPAPRPEPVYSPNCADPGQPSGPVQQAAWNAACAPVVEPPPVPAPGPTPQPTTGPLPDPTPTPLPTPTQPPAGPAGNNGEDTAPGGATAGASASPSPTWRRNWPPRPQPTPTPTPTPTATPTPLPTPSASIFAPAPATAPTPSGSAPAPSPSATTEPSPSLPRGAELA